jgi:hypothetical protein
MNMGVIYWIYPNLILANSPIGVEIIGRNEIGV